MVTQKYVTFGLLVKGNSHRKGAKIISPRSDKSEHLSSHRDKGIESIIT